MISKGGESEANHQISTTKNKYDEIDALLKDEILTEEKINFSEIKAHEIHHEAKKS